MKFFFDLADLQCRPAPGGRVVPYPYPGDAEANTVEVATGAELAAVLRRNGIAPGWSGSLELRPPPAAPAPVPIPYPNTGAVRRMQDELHRAGYRNVRLAEAVQPLKVGSKTVATHPSSPFVMSKGDEAGTAARRGTASARIRTTQPPWVR